MMNDDDFYDLTRNFLTQGLLSETPAKNSTDDSSRKINDLCKAYDLYENMFINEEEFFEIFEEITRKNKLLTRLLEAKKVRIPGE